MSVAEAPECGLDELFVISSYVPTSKFSATRNQPVLQEGTQRLLLSKENKRKKQLNLVNYVVTIDFHVVLNRTIDGLVFCYIQSHLIKKCFYSFVLFLCRS